MLPLVLAASLSFTAHDAAALATMDKDNVPLHARPYIRYVWVKTGLPEDVKLTSFTTTWISNGSPILMPAVVGGGKMATLIRIDARDHWRTADVSRALRTWEELAFDPSFNVLYTFDTIKLLLDHGGDRPDWLASTSAVLKQFSVKTNTGEKMVSVFRDPYVDIEALSAELHTNAPIVESDYFIIRALSSIETDPGANDQGVFKTIFGGLYYRFTGIRTARDAGKKKATDWDVLLEDLGIIDDADVFASQAKWDRLGSERRIAIRRSNVTGKSRVVCFVPTGKANRSVLTFTLDNRDGDIDIFSNPFRNLLRFRGAAIEAIWDEDGRQKYALFSVANGALQAEVPPQVAHDTTVPEPYTQRLQIISCITCHAGPKGNNGWQPLVNDAIPILPRLVPDPARGLFDEEVRLTKEKFSYDPTTLLMDLRRGTMACVLKATGPWDIKIAKDQTEVFRLTADHLIAIRGRFWFTPLDAAAVLNELGYSHGQEKPADYLRSNIGQPDFFEDADIVALVDGAAISRAQVSLIKGFVSSRLERSARRR